MKYHYQIGVIEERYGRKIVTAAIASVMTFTALSAFAFAHNVRDVVLSGEKNCVGLLASDHAKNSSDRGLKGELEAHPHRWLARPAQGYLETTDASTGEEMKAISEACRDYRDVGPAVE